MVRQTKGWIDINKLFIISLIHARDNKIEYLPLPLVGFRTNCFNLNWFSKRLTLRRLKKGGRPYKIQYKKDLEEALLV